MASNPFIGTWRLVSFEHRTLDGQIICPQGDNPLGYLIYNEQGYMSVAFMSAHRVGFASGDIRGGSAEEKVAAFDSYISLCGKYEIEGQKVYHHIEVSLFPDWIGVTQERFFEFTENRLSLSAAPFLLNGRQRTVHVIWERA